MDPVFQAHPIPQNVTNFEFHLVGDMTIKQFGYLAIGLAIAFVTFIGLAQPFPWIAWPIIVISAATGAAFAFIPIQERPLDHWMAAFFKAIFHPTKLVYDSKILRKEDPYFSKRLNFYIKNKHAGERTVGSLGVPPPIPGGQTLTSMATTTAAPSQRKPSMADRLLAGQTAPSTAPNAPQHANSQPQLLGSMPSFGAPATPPKPREVPKPADLKKTVDLAKDAQETQSKILKIEKQLEQIKATVAQPGADAKYYVDQFQSLLTDLQKLNEHASGTAHDLAILANTPVTPTVPAAAAPYQPAPPTPAPAKTANTVKLTSFPNVINGIVTDSQGNYVEGAIVVAHDKQGLPVRALRSNKLGQFVAATPLPEGPYTIVVEKDNMVFDQVAIELKNEVPQPILVSAKKQIPVATA